MFNGKCILGREMLIHTYIEIILKKRIIVTENMAYTF